MLQRLFLISVSFKMIFSLIVLTDMLRDLIHGENLLPSLMFGERPGAYPFWVHLKLIPLGLAMVFLTTLEYANEDYDSLFC